MKKIMFLLVLPLLMCQLMAQQQLHTVKKLKITILSTMLAQKGIGEWGFAALIEADSVKLLFDAGGRETTVLENCKELKIDLRDVPELILSHGHGDHTAGWLPLRNALQKMNSAALSVTHAGKGLFDTRIAGERREFFNRRNDSLQFVQTGGIVKLHDRFTEIHPGIYLTGPVPRKYPEKNYSLGKNSIQKKDDAGNLVEDNIPEDMSLVIRTENGLVLISGCGHSGMINTVTYMQAHLQQPLYAAIGGFHLLENTDEQIKWTADELKKTGIRYFMGAHCTGIEPVYQIRNGIGLKRGECIVGSVGAVFETGKGFIAGALTK